MHTLFAASGSLITKRFSKKHLTQHGGAASST